MTRILGALPDEAAARGGDLGCTFLDETGEERFVSYLALRERVCAVAGGLRERGLRPGARVAIAVDDPFAFVTTFLGAARDGLVPMPLAPHAGLRPPDAYARAVLPTLRVAAPALVVADARTEPLLAPHAPVVTPAALRGEPVREPRAVASASPALIQFTSGSTSDPRGVVLTHDALFANMHAISTELRVAAGDVGVSWLPLHHDMGLVGMMLTSLRNVIPMVIMPPRVFVKSPGAWLRALARHRGTVSFAPSSAYAMAARRVRERDLDGLDLSAWRVAGVGAEPVHAEDLERFADRLAPAGFDRRAFAPSYGLAEHVVAAALGPIGRGLRVDTARRGGLAEGGRADPCDAREPHAARLVACGRPLPDHELVIVDEMGAALSERRVGRIRVRGPSQMLGYHGHPPAPGAWIDTGDLGYLADGDLFVCGRTKEVIIRAGEKLHPRDLECAALRLPFVRAAAAIGVSRDATERIVLFVECMGPTDAARTHEIAAAVQGECGARVDEVRVVPAQSLPRTTSGKLQRLDVRARYLDDPEWGIAS